MQDPNYEIKRAYEVLDHNFLDPARRAGRIAGERDAVLRITDLLEDRAKKMAEMGAHDYAFILRDFSLNIQREFEIFLGKNNV